MEKLTYARAGVDRDAADQLVTRISDLAKTTLGIHRAKMRSTIGGYASLYAIDTKRTLAASTDGVGTKLKLAFELGLHSTVGIDLVAMSVNDLLCVGAEPLFFLDYFATGKLLPETAQSVISGVVAGCKQAGCALVGGETAEMPDLYGEGEYDLAGFAVGMVDKPKILPKTDIKSGDVLIGLASSGFHSNGFSLLRKLLPADGAERRAIAEELLTPTRIYCKEVLPLIRSRKIKGLAHITGSGFLNVPRMSTRVNYEIDLPDESELPTVFEWVRKKSGLPLSELASTFNMGLGMMIAVSPLNASFVMKELKKKKQKAWICGKVVSKQKGQKAQSIVGVHSALGESASLEY